MELLESLPAKKNKINFKKEILKYLKYWYWILLSMLLFYIAAKIYLRYTESQYISKTTLQFPESKARGATTALNDLATLGTGLSGNSELQSETTAILSKPILSKVVESLNLNVSFFGQGAVIEPELYTASPLEAKIVYTENPNFTSTSYIISPEGKNTYNLSEGPLKDDKKTFAFGSLVDLPFGKVIINKKAGANLVNPIKIVFKNTESLVSGLENAVMVSLPENKGLLMDLSLTGKVPAKSVAILDEITKYYNEEGVKDRALEAQNTQDFINGRLEIISQDLSGIEGEKESFKRQNEITDLDAQANMALANSNQNTKQIMNLATQLDLINSIFNSSNTEKLLPSNMGLSSVTESYIGKYNDLLLTRNKTLKQASAINPSVIELNKEIAELRSLIRQNLQESKESLRLQIASLNGQLSADRSKIDNYPTQEKVFRSIERQQNLKEQLYLYLLQKREENAITLAVTAPKAKVLNPAYTIGIVSPKRQQILGGALLAGLLLPLLIVYAKNTLDTKVHTKAQLQAHIPNALVLAEIPLHDQDKAVVTTNDFSVFAESFRILTSNLKFIFKTKEEDNANANVILVTSSIKGEGKTTIAMNTALTLAGASKVIIIGADIRNPQLQRFMTEQKKGLTDYLISKDQSPQSYIVNSTIHENLDVLFSGAIAPNPTDLLDMPKFDRMIDELRTIYDYIILDSAPVMLVSDSLHLVDTADVVLYVVKSDYTENDMLDFAQEFRTIHHVNNMSFVLNNVKPENTRYGNKYGYGYYGNQNTNERKRLNKIF